MKSLQRIFTMLPVVLLACTMIGCTNPAGGGSGSKQSGDGSKQSGGGGDIAITFKNVETNTPINQSLTHKSDDGHYYLTLGPNTASGEEMIKNMMWWEFGKIEKGEKIPLYRGAEYTWWSENTTGALAIDYLFLFKEKCNTNSAVEYKKNAWKICPFNDTEKTLTIPFAKSELEVNTDGAESGTKTDEDSTDTGKNDDPEGYSCNVLNENWNVVSLIMQKNQE